MIDFNTSILSLIISLLLVTMTIKYICYDIYILLKQTNPNIFICLIILITFNIMFYYIKKYIHKLYEWFISIFNHNNI